tara:strand:- start:2056 stop:3111 length:1056 start_codon:yes stop_codon:yes gene_type:complete
MGQEELNLLKESLLKIGDIDDNIMSLKGQIKDKKKSLKDLENKISKNESEVKSLEEKNNSVVVPTADFEFNKKRPISHHEELIKSIENNERKSEVSTNWINRLSQIGSKIDYYHAEGITSKILGIVILIASMITIMYALEEIPGAYDYELDEPTDLGGAIICCCIIPLSFTTFAILAEAISGRRIKTVMMRLDDEFGTLEKVSPEKAKSLCKVNYSADSRCGSLIISKVSEGTPLTPDSPENKGKNTKLFNKTDQLIPISLHPSEEEISRIEKLENELIILRKRRKIEQDVTKNKEKIEAIRKTISKDSSKIPEIQQKISSYLDGVKSFQKQRDDLWDSISHLIPYSDLID